MTIKERLAQEGYSADMEMLRKAILLPQELLMKPTDKKYPTPGIGLM